MSNTEDIAEANELNNPNNNDFGHYVTAFFLVTGDRYLRPSRGRTRLGFFNRRGYRFDIPEAASYLMVLYQRSGSSEFSIQLIPGSYNRDASFAQPGGLTEMNYDEQDPRDPWKRINRHAWTMHQGISQPRFLVNIKGKSIDIYISNGDQNHIAAYYSDQQEGDITGWRFSGESRIILSITTTDLDGKNWNIPSKTEMLSGTAFNDADFFGIEFNAIALRACNLPRANFTNAKLTDVRFDLSELPGARFSTDTRPDHQHPNFLRSCRFPSANLSNAVFEGAILEQCSFERADLTGANFTRARLINTSFVGANLSKTDFSEVDFTPFIFDGTLSRGDGNGTIFRNARLPYSLIGNNWQYLNLSKATFSGNFPTGKIEAKGVLLIGSQLSGLNFTGADFTNAKLAGANFTGANLSNAILTGADLTGTDLTGANLTGATLSGTILASTILKKADLTGVIFPEAPKFGRTAETRTRMHETIVHISFLGTDWSYLDLTGIKFTTKDAPPKPLHAPYVILDEVNFHDTDLEGANFEFAQLKKVQFPSANLRNAKMISAILIGGTFTNANMWGVDLTNADVTSAKFEGVELFNGKLKGATVVNTWFNDAYLAAMDFSDIKGKALQGCNFSYACLVNAKFNNTRLGAFGDQNTSFAGASLQGAQFEGADLKGVNLTDAFIAAEDGILKATIRAMTGEQSLIYDPTKIEARVTDSSTTCPNRTSGPCNVVQMKSTKPNTNTWAHKKTIKEMDK